MQVRVTVTVGKKTLPLDQVTDTRVSTALRTAARDVGAKLERVRCPEHDKTAQNVRLHFDAAGNADLKYDSCCQKLGKAIQRTL